MVEEARVEIRGDADIVSARQEGRRIAALAGLSGSNLTIVATAISELARNIVEYARQGVVEIAVLEVGTRRGVVVYARDDGPGIPDLALAMQDGWSSGRSLGIGLPGARRLMDEFEIESALGRGTIVRAVKWAR